MWKIQEIIDKPKRYHRIRCFTCAKDAGDKSRLRQEHADHDVHYVNRDGSLDE